MAIVKDPAMFREKNTIMYSIEPDKDGKPQIVEHRLPWDRNNKYSASKFQRLLERGYTFDRPDMATATLSKPETNAKCPQCGKECKDESGLYLHMRHCKGKNTVPENLN